MFFIQSHTDCRATLRICYCVAIKGNLKPSQWMTWSEFFIGLWCCCCVGCTFCLVLYCLWLSSHFCSIVFVLVHFFFLLLIERWWGPMILLPQCWDYDADLSQFGGLSFLFGVSVLGHTMFRHREAFRLAARSDTFENVKCFSNSLYGVGVLRICMDSASDKNKK